MDWNTLSCCVLIKRTYFCSACETDTVPFRMPWLFHRDTPGTITHNTILNSLCISPSASNFRLAITSKSKLLRTAAISVVAAWTWTDAGLPSRTLYVLACYQYEGNFEWNQCTMLQAHTTVHTSAFFPRQILPIPALRLNTQQKCKRIAKHAIWPGLTINYCPYTVCHIKNCTSYKLTFPHTRMQKITTALSI